MEATGRKRNFRKELEELHVSFLETLFHFSKQEGSSPKKRQVLQRMVEVSQELSSIKKSMNTIKQENNFQCQHGFVLIRKISHSVQRLCLLCGEETFQ